ncbi:MAG: type I-MYXAN CRISPR-associated protein Cas6/Cmx6 [Gammaproteobacteria bacterium]|nr:type I-MYXAN CRISPR-associated protein Cas6/Cmx6 [Gammaproteobacteria bacterium]
MFWQEETDEAQFVVPDDVVDLLFKIKCATLPVDHAWPLSEAILSELPWFSEESLAGLHLIYGADSGNGWERPQAGDDLLYLSRRTRLILRLPQHRVEDARTLTGKTLDIQGNRLEVGEAHTRNLATSTTLYCRHLVTDTEMHEDEFMGIAVEALREMQIRFKKILCGKSGNFATPEGDLPTQSLMVSGLPLEDAITLQQHGLGPHRNRGFGLFVPHKTV